MASSHGEETPATAFRCGAVYWRENRLDDLKYLSTLDMHGHILARSVIIEPHPAPIPTLWFGFPKKAVRIVEDDCATRFETSFNGWMIQAKFDPRQMWYHGSESL